MTIDVVKEEQLCSLGDEAEALLKTEAFLIFADLLRFRLTQIICTFSAE